MRTPVRKASTRKAAVREELAKLRPSAPVAESAPVDPAPESTDDRVRRIADEQIEMALLGLVGRIRTDTSGLMISEAMRATADGMHDAIANHTGNWTPTEGT